MRQIQILKMTSETTLFQTFFVTDAKEKEKFMRYLLARFTPSIDIDKAMAARTQKIALYMNVFEMTPENITEKAKDRGYMHYFGKQRPGKKDSD